MDPRLRAYLTGLKAVGMWNYQDMNETGERFFLGAYLSNMASPLVLDVGANKGDYSAAVLEAAPTTKLHCFEPMPICVDALKTRFAGKGVEIHPLALGDESATMKLWDRKEGLGSGHATLHREMLSVLPKPEEAVSFDVEVRRLDDIAESLGLSTIALLKIDVEGHELRVLKGAAQLIAQKRVAAIQFEFGATHVFSRTFMRDFYEFLPQYRFYRLLPQGFFDITKYDPLICEVFVYCNVVCMHSELVQFRSG